MAKNDDPDNVQTETTKAPRGMTVRRVIRSGAAG